MKLVHCINLPERKERRENAQKQADEQGFRIQFWDGIREPKTATHTNISRAHKQIVLRAKSAKIPSVIIMEDDCVFTHPKAFQYFLDSRPKYYHLYMGLIYSGHIENNRVLNGFSGGMTLYWIHSSFYDVFLGADEKDNIDRWCGKRAGQFKFLVCNPMVVRQHGGYSDHFRRIMTYEGYEQSITFYQGHP